jgi:hypothetical protein
MAWTLRVIKIIDNATITIIDGGFHGGSKYRWPPLCPAFVGDHIGRGAIAQ